MKNLSFYKDENENDKKAVPLNFELWDEETRHFETNKEAEFHSGSSNVTLRVKNIDRDLVPDGFQEILEA